MERAKLEGAVGTLAEGDVVVHSISSRRHSACSRTDACSSPPWLEISPALPCLLHWGEGLPWAWVAQLLYWWDEA